MRPPALAVLLLTGALPAFGAPAAPAPGAPPRPAAKPASRPLSGGPDLPSRAPLSTPLCVVNGEKVPLSTYVDRLSLRFGPEIREALVAETLLAQEARKRKISVTAAEVDRALKRVFDETAGSRGGESQLAAELLRARGWSLSDFRAALRPEAAAQALREKLAASLVKPASITAKEVEVRYDERRSSLAQPDAVRISHIMVRKPVPTDSAQDAAARTKAKGLLRSVVAAKGANFAELARANSNDRLSADQGGKLPFDIMRGAHPFGAAFEAAVFSASVGLVEQVVASPDGYHVIRVDSKSEGKTPTLSQAQDTLRAELLAEKRQRALTELYGKLRASARVEAGKF